MKAWTIRGDAASPELVLGESPRPEAGPKELLVRVRAIGVNRADLARRTGHYEQLQRLSDAPIPGLELAGEVAAVGANVTGWRVGDRVMGLPPAAYAAFARLPADMAIRVPSSLSWEQAAALPMAYLTAHNALVTEGRFARGDHLLVHGVSSGVGLATVQIARLLGAGVIAGTASPQKHAALAPYGVDVPLAHGDAQAAERIGIATGQHGVDVIVDMAGASAAQLSQQAAGLRARWVQVGRLGGAKADIDLDLLARKRLSLIGVTFRTRSVEEIAALVQAAAHDLTEAWGSGQLSMPIAKVFPFEQADAAQAFMRQNAHVGKIVIEGCPD
ncbi:zinc-binding dehydrogenase [Hydrogenophaga sp. BPS33]|uniref:zinc-binding dehydrogenase n=1 Tax=Hydrogenophaga sp. BPS33 TaxID=2651974 RepID=UPI0013596282|nr:zinc-binding dehydrogenase [Hydrogenophaga sp. BPS33]